MTLRDFEITAGAIEAATTPEDIFGVLTGPDADKLRAVVVQFRAMTKIVHPDRLVGAADAVKLRATTVFATLGRYKASAEGKIQAGTYGDRTVSAPEAPAPMTSVTIETKRWTYQADRVFTLGDLADIYVGTRLPKRGDEPEPVLLKVAQNAADNDLLEHEAKVLAALAPKSPADTKTAHRLLPVLLDTLRLQGRRGTKPRQVNVLSSHQDHVSLAEVHRVHTALDYRDVVWMVKRALIVLGHAHRAKVIHGAVLPPHLLVHPEHHGAKLVGWSVAAMGPGDKVKAKVKAWASFYPPELGKSAPTPALDLYMLGKCAVYLLGGDVEASRLPDMPRDVHDFFARLLIADPARRPNDAWQLHDDLNSVLKRVVGDPVYRKLDMPPRS